MAELNDFGFSTLSAEDYANQQKLIEQTLQTTASATDVQQLKLQLEVLLKMVQAIDDKVDAIGESGPSTDPDLVPRSRLVQMANLILPLLRNLRDTAQDDYILWPNRGPICQAQINQIEALLK